MWDPPPRESKTSTRESRAKAPRKGCVKAERRKQRRKQSDSGNALKYSCVRSFTGNFPRKQPLQVRRLYFESSTMAVAELNSRVQRDDASEPSKMPVPERIARLESHKLVDKICQMATDQLLEWLPWDQLTSRAREITHSQKEFKISFDSSGSLKVCKKDSQEEVPIFGGMKIRQAPGRRAKAFDLANLCSFTIMETWHERMFELLNREPHANADRITKIVRSHTRGPG